VVAPRLHIASHSISGSSRDKKARTSRFHIPVSNALFSRVQHATVFPKGVWGGTNGDLFERFPEMTKPIHAASDHAALVVDLAI
jgi:hypothetical protein